MRRLFAAISIPDSAADGLARLQRGVAGAQWRPRESLHLTLRFAGETSEPRASDFAAELAACGAGVFELALTGAGSFDDAHGVRALWVGVGESEPLRRLARRCEAAARRAGLAPDRRPWRPHVTLAYTRRVDPREAALWIQAHNLARIAPFTVENFGLYSSWRTGEGSVYRLERFYRLS